MNPSTAFASTSGINAKKIQGYPVESGRPSQGNALLWDDEAGGWRHGAPGDIVGATQMLELTDVSITAVSEGQILQWNGTDWVNIDFPETAAQLSELSDVTLTDLTTGQRLIWNGTVWVNSAVPPAELALDELTDASNLVKKNGDTIVFRGLAGWVSSRLYRPVGDWNIEQDYIIDDVVLYNNAQYLCTADVVGDVPTDSVSWFALGGSFVTFSLDPPAVAEDTAAHIGDMWVRTTNGHFYTYRGSPTFWELSYVPADVNITLLDVTDGNVDATRHGFVPKTPADATKYLNGLGAWATPVVSSGMANPMIAVGDIITGSPSGNRALAYLGASFTGVSQYGNEILAQAFDGNDASWWYANHDTASCWAEVNFGSVQNITGMRLKQSGGNQGAGAYNVQIPDGIGGYTTVYSHATVLTDETWSFPAAIQSRIIRIQVTAAISGSGEWWKVYSLELLSGVAGAALRLPAGVDGAGLRLLNGVPVWDDKAGNNPMLLGGDMSYGQTASNVATSGNGASASGYGGSQIIDGDNSTPAGRSTPYIAEHVSTVLDLGSVRTIGTVRVVQQASPGLAHYKIFTSIDGATWVELLTHVTVGTDESYSIPVTSSRYWLFQTTTAVAADDGWGLRTIEMYPSTVGAPVRLPAGTEGQILKMVGGVPIWAPGLPEHRYTPPPALSTWTWVNQGIATADELLPGTIYLDTGVGPGANVKMLARATPATPYSIITAFTALITNTGYSGCGVGWRESSSGKLALANLLFNYQFEYMKWGSPTAWSADYVMSRAFTWNPVWVRLSDDGTNRTVDLSSDGVHWMNIHTVGRTDYLTPDQLVINGNPDGASGRAGLTLLSWA